MSCLIKRTKCKNPHGRHDENEPQKQSNTYGYNNGTENYGQDEITYADKTKADDVIESFESSFADKQVIPRELEIVWLQKAVGRYSAELDPIVFHKDIDMFDTKLDRYVIDTLAQFMYQLYQERQVSLVNKRVSIVGKDLSVDGSNGTKTAEKAHLSYVETKASEMVDNQKPSAYV